ERPVPAPAKKADLAQENRAAAPAKKVDIAKEPAKPALSSWMVGVVVEEGEAQLVVQNGSENRTVCKELLLETVGGQLQLGICDRQVQLNYRFFQAAADRLTRTAVDDCLVLEGHVWLQCHEEVQHAEVFAERILVSLKDGHL